MDDLIDKHRARIAAANEKLKKAFDVATADHSAEILDSEVALEAGMKMRHDACRGVTALKMPVVTMLSTPADQADIPPKLEDEDAQP